MENLHIMVSSWVGALCLLVGQLVGLSVFVLKLNTQHQLQFQN